MEAKLSKNLSVFALVDLFTTVAAPQSNTPGKSVRFILYNA